MFAVKFDLQYLSDLLHAGFRMDFNKKQASIQEAKYILVREGLQLTTRLPFFKNIPVLEQVNRTFKVKKVIGLKKKLEYLESLGNLVVLHPPLNGADSTKTDQVALALPDEVTFHHKGIVVEIT